MKSLDFAAVSPGDHTVDDEEEDQEEDEDVETSEAEVANEEEESSEEEDEDESESEEEKSVPEVKPKVVKEEPLKAPEEIAGFVKKSGLANTENAGIQASPSWDSGQLVLVWLRHT